VARGEWRMKYQNQQGIILGLWTFSRLKMIVGVAVVAFMNASQYFLELGNDSLLLPTCLGRWQGSVIYR